MDERKGLPSASSADRIHSCPASIRLERGLPDLTEDPLAKKGDRIHQWLYDKSVELNKGEQKIADRCVKLEEEVLTTILNAKLVGDFREGAMREKRQWIQDYSGKADAIYRFEKEGSQNVVTAFSIILDYKTGCGDDYQSSTSKQLQDLAMIEDENCEVKPNKIYTAIIQPGKKPEICELSRDDLNAIKERFKNTISQVETAEPKSGKHCLHCKSKLKCNKFTQELVKAAEPTLAPRLEYMSNEDIESLYSKVSAIEKTCKAIKEEMKDRVKSGSIDTYYVNSVKSHKISDMTNFIEEFSANFEIEDENISKILDVNLKKAREVLIEMGISKESIQQFLDNSPNVVEAVTERINKKRS